MNTAIRCLVLLALLPVLHVGADELTELRAQNKMLNAQAAVLKKQLAAQRAKVYQLESAVANGLARIDALQRQLATRPTPPSAPAPKPSPATKPSPAATAPSTRPAAPIPFDFLRGVGILLSPLKAPLRLGAVGQFKHGLKVTQIIDSQNMLIYVYLSVRGRISSRGHEVGPYTAADEHTLWLSGVATKGVVNGTYVDTRYLFRVVGTQRYPTATGGTKTVFHVKPVLGEGRR